MRIGIVKTSLMENERRLAIHPDHVPNMPKDLVRNMVFERGYCIDYGRPDSYVENYGASLADRDQLFTDCELIVLPKPTTVQTVEDSTT